MLVIVFMSEYEMRFIFFFFFKQKTAYEMRISDWSSDVYSSDLLIVACADDDDALIIDHDVGTMGPRLPQNRWRNDVSVDVDTRLFDFIPCDHLNPLLDI